MELSTVWFILIAVLWTGYFVLEGFDFGVGMLLPVLGRGGDAADTEGETPVAVVIIPKTNQGCRPVSVKIQPTAAPNTGISGVSTAVQVQSRSPRLSDRVRTRPRRVAQRTTRATRADSIPTPIMSRKLQ